MTKIDWVIGIDPDVDKNGVAYLVPASKQIELRSLSFPDTLDYLNSAVASARLNQKTLRVIIEAGWLNKAHWHLMPRDTKQIAAAKGNAAGRNHEVGRKLAEMCQHWQIPYELVKPLTKIWNGPNRKVSHEELARFILLPKKRTNQEERDAALLSWVWAGLPVKA